MRNFYLYPGVVDLGGISIANTRHDPRRVQIKVMSIGS